MRLLITAHQDNWTKTQNTKPRSLDMERLAIEFDGFPRPVAERALRFIRAFALAKPVANFTHH